MAGRFQKLNSDTLKEQFIKQIERMIISGELKEGQQLPPERELCAEMGVSRGIVNAGIAELAAKGLLRIVPRRGTFVSSFEEDGTISALELIMNYSDGSINHRLFLDMVEVKRHLESRCAYLAAANRTEQDLEEMRRLVERINAENDLDALTELNFSFHHRIALATQNTVYSLIDKSFEPVSRNIIRDFYKKPPLVRRSRRLIELIYGCIRDRDALHAAEYIRNIFDYAEKALRSEYQDNTTPLQ